MVLRERHRRGGTVQVLADPGGIPLWVSAVRPGSVHDPTAAQELAFTAPEWTSTRVGPCDAPVACIRKTGKLRRADGAATAFEACNGARTTQS